MIPQNSLFRRLINYYNGVNDELLQLIVYYEGEHNKAKASNDYSKQKLCIRLISQLKAEQLQTREGIYYWKKKEEEFFN